MLSEISRRELLAAFLGFPVAASGCALSSGRAEPLPPGELVGASVSLGHRLRDTISRQSLAERVAPEQWRDVSVLIVGGGIAGLSAARRLLQANVDDFVLLELEPAAGGTSRGGSNEVVDYPWGAHYVPAPTHENPELVELLEELNAFEGRDQQGDPIVAEQFRCRDPQERLFYKGRWYEGLYLYAGASSEDLRQLKQFRRQVDHWVRWRDGRNRRAFALPMAAGSDDSEVVRLDRISLAQWCDQHRFNSPRLRWLLDFACRDDYGMTADQTSAWAGLFYFASRMRKAGEDSRPFITWPEGNGRVVAHLHQQARRQVQLKWAVAEIAPTKSGKVEVIALNGKDQRLAGFRARRVIFAAPQFLARYLIKPFRTDPPAHLNEFQYGAWAVANLTLQRNPESDGWPLSWDNVLYDSPSLGYVCATHQRGMDYGKCMLTWYYPLCDDNPAQARRRLLELGREEWAEIALADLDRAHVDFRRQIERIDVMRWGHAMIRPRVGFIWGDARRAAAAPYLGIHFAHSDLSGLPLLEEAFYRGVRAAEEVL